MKEGALTVKEKELIAVAHATQCPYCIDVHTQNAKKAGASLEELVEAVFVTASIEAGGALAHSTHVQNAVDPEADDVLYRRSNLNKVANLNKWAPDGFNALLNFANTAVKEGKLSAKMNLPHLKKWRFLAIGTKIVPRIIGFAYNTQPLVGNLTKFLSKQHAPKCKGRTRPSTTSRLSDT
jgi:AhpD family alkylhydroperoxidase